MSRKLLIKLELPVDISIQDAVEIAYSKMLDEVFNKLSSGLSTEIECEKELVPHLLRRLRERFRDKSVSKHNLRLISGISQKDGVEIEKESGGILQSTLNNLKNAVYHAAEDEIIAILNLDLITTVTRSGLTAESREVSAILYENPTLVMLIFKDPSFQLPEVISDLFPIKVQIAGISRQNLPNLITQREARKLSFKEFDPYLLYKFSSGLNAVKFRMIMSSFCDVDNNGCERYPDVEPETANRIIDERIAILRNMTIKSNFELPNVSIDRDIGGYDKVKQRLRREIIDLVSELDNLENPDEISELEGLIPRGIIFTGPPGTGKTLFAKALATELNATVIVVSGPELKSKWFGETEENIRRIFAKARQSAPSIIIFDEIDSIAPSRTQSIMHDVTHSTVNQLLTEIDGFRSDELVFVVGTTNFSESLDQALLRPGRFVLRIEMPPPNENERKSILTLYRQKLKMAITNENLDYLVSRTEGFYDARTQAHFSGDHLHSLMKAIKRETIRRKSKNSINRMLIDSVFAEIRGTSQKLTSEEMAVSAVHEAGHALLMELIDEAPDCEKISIMADDEYAAGYTIPQLRQKRLLNTKEVRSMITVALGGRVAEELIFKTVSIGCEHDLYTATEIARYMTTVSGLIEGENNLRSFYSEQPNSQQIPISAEKLREIDESIEKILKEEYLRAKTLIGKNLKIIGDLQAVLLEKTILYREDFLSIVEKVKK
ncbi:MAG: AAA family ATPase [Planctomycetes bacterium]|nr:AAA family ATPase [Planctomycetota bacterium]